MPYVAPGTAVVGQVYTASAHNIIVNDVIDHESRLLKMGLTFVNSSTFSAQTTVTLDNVFTSTYANYRVVISAYQTASAGVAAANIQMRTGGVTYAGANYDCAGLSIFADASTSPTGLSGQTSMVAAVQVNGTNAGTNHGYTSFELFAPNLATWTSMFSTRMAFNAAPNQFFTGFYGAQVKQTTQYDGIAITCASAMTGTLRIYGYLNS